MLLHGPAVTLWHDVGNLQYLEDCTTNRHTLKPLKRNETRAHTHTNTHTHTQTNKHTHTHSHSHSHAKHSDTPSASASTKNGCPCFMSLDTSIHATYHVCVQRALRTTRLTKQYMMLQYGAISRFAMHVVLHVFCRCGLPVCISVYMYACVRTGMHVRVHGCLHMQMCMFTCVS